MIHATDLDVQRARRGACHWWRKKLEKACGKAGPDIPEVLLFVFVMRLDSFRLRRSAQFLADCFKTSCARSNPRFKSFIVFDAHVSACFCYD